MRTDVICLTFGIVLILKCIHPVSGDDVCPYSVYLDRSHRLKLSWLPNYQKATVYFSLMANISKGTWFGVGFSDYGEVTEADLVVYWTSSRGVHHFQCNLHRPTEDISHYKKVMILINNRVMVSDRDLHFFKSPDGRKTRSVVNLNRVFSSMAIKRKDSHTDSQGRLLTDRQQDYELQRASTRDHVILLKFYRKFDTCDKHDYQFDRGTTHVIFFLSTLPFKSPDGINVTELSPGLQRVQLLKPEVPDILLPDDTWTFEVTTPNIEVPAQETTYWWYTAKLPPLSHKHHIIKYEGVIQAGNEDLVHHMEVFHCEVAANAIIRFYNGPGQSEGKPPELESCRKVIGAWAMGATALTLPEEAGYPLGGPKYSRFVLLEVHFNNPEIKKGRLDNSGIRFYVTSKLRRYDAGVMELGLEYTNKMAIPPREEGFDLIGYCIAECTKISLPPKGITIFASQLHTHLTGRRVYTKHVRNGIELPELNRDNHYSPHFQEIRKLPDPVRVLPGDALVTTCKDRTADRPNATIGGFAISDEMCVNYVHYYPLVDLEVCKSSITTHALHRFFNFMNKWDLDDTSPTKGDRANYNSIRWTPLTSLLLKTLYQTSPLSMQCNQSNGHRIPGDWENLPKTEIILPLGPEPRRCAARTPFIGRELKNSRSTHNQ